MANPQVMILMGSDSDLSTLAECCKELERFGIGFEIHVSSAHRTPAKTEKLVKEAEGRGIKVLVCAAGGAAHLAGVAAAQTTLPVLAVPILMNTLGGADSLYSMVQMPQGIPVGTFAIGKAGAGNAGIFAAQILALSDKAVAEKLKAFKEDMASKVEKKDAELQSKGYAKYIEDHKG
jgi:5-(carboxyamino)imidazole ribonucleotide mutase